MLDAWNSYQERATLGDVLMAPFDCGSTDNHTLEALIVGYSVLAAFERRVDDGFDGVLIEGCRRTIELLRPPIEGRLQKRNVGSFTEGEVATIAIELATWAHKRNVVREIAEDWLFHTRANVFSNIEYTRGYRELAVYPLEYDASKVDISLMPKSSHFETIVQTMNRALAIVEYEKSRGNYEGLVGLHLLVMGCKRLGSELLGWRY